MKSGIFRFLLLSVLGGFCALDAFSAVSLFSNYGQIQNVQNYSTNPFWSPNSPYNQRLPQPVYVQGADLNTADCTSVVQSLVAVQCMVRDNCRDTKLAEIRPEIMVQLSKLPNNNYVSACSGYIDSIFEEYVKQYGNSVPTNRAIAFPDATEPNRNINNNNGVQIKNPYQIKTPQWQQEMQERSDELEALQRENGAGTEHLTATDFPATFADLSFNERVQIETAGYEPYKDMKAYKTPNFVNVAEWCGDNEHANSQECIAYNDCTDTITVEHLVRATYNADHTVCEVKACDTGYTPNKYKNACINTPGKDCTQQKKASFPNGDPQRELILRAEYDANGECVIKICAQNYGGVNYHSPSGHVCEENIGTFAAQEFARFEQTPAAAVTATDCTASISDKNVEKAEIDANGDCKITKCKNGWHPKEPDKTECEGDICSQTKKHNLAKDASKTFAGIQVHTVEIAQKLTEEYLKCSATPDLQATEIYFTVDMDDLLRVVDSNDVHRYSVTFDDVTEKDGVDFGKGTIRALCLIANGTLTENNCSGITETQFNEISNLVESLIAPIGEQFEGLGTKCYTITFYKSKKMFEYAISGLVSCKNEIIIQP